MQSFSCGRSFLTQAIGQPVQVATLAPFAAYWDKQS